MKPARRSFWILVGISIVLSFGALLRATLPHTTIGTWTAANSLSQARSKASVVMLPNGSILIAGGASGNGALQSAELFGTDGTVTSAGAMNVARSGHFAVVLSDGRVLVGGGLTSGGGTTNSAEIYDPSAGTWTATNPMTSARANATAAVLQDGRVVIAGGDNTGAPSNTIEIFDPSSGNFTFAGTMSASRAKHAMAVLQDGRVLIVGGFDGTNPLASSDIFDPSSGNASAGPNLTTARYAHTATTLLNGQVAVIGGAGSDGNGGTIDLASAEVFDPSTGAFTVASGSLTTAREGHQAYLLPKNNSVLIMGGTSNGTVVAASELFTSQANSTTGAWSYAVTGTGAVAPATGSNVVPRSAATGSAMQQDGLLLAAGGTDASGNALASTELFAFPIVKTDHSDYPPGTTVNITGGGFAPDETITITLVESPLIDTHGPYTVTADGNGNITDSSFTTDTHDVGVKFYMSAVGSQSGLVAQNTFLDNANKLQFTTTAFTAAAGACSPTITVGTFQGSTASPPNSNESIALTSSSGTGGFYSNNTCTTSISTVTITTSQTTASFFYKDTTAGTPTITATPTPALPTPTQVETITALATSLTVSAASGTYGGSTGTITAHLTKTSDGSNLGGKTVSFTLNGGSVGSAVTDANGIATLTSASLTSPTKINAGSFPAGVGESFAGDSTFSASSATNSLTVNKEALTITAATNSKTYDGSALAAATPTITSGTLASGDTANFTEAYPSKNVGTGLTLTPSGTVTDGNSGNNYTYTFDNNTGVINARALTVTAAANTKPYDGTTSAAATPTITAGAVQTGDTANFTEAYSTTNMGTGLTLTPSGSVSDGNSGNNYSYTFVTSANGTITGRSITVTAATNTKTYEGTTSAAATPTITSGTLAAGDVANFTEVYASKNAGTGLTLTPSGTVTNGGNNETANYAITFVNSTSGVINKLALTVTAATNTKTYDGTTSAAATPTITSGAVQTGDTANFSEVYNNKNVGTGKTLTPSGAVSDGNSGNNYTYTIVTNTTGVINAMALTVMATTNSKAYDGTTTATATPTITSGALQGTDTANFTETYASKNVGTGLTLTPSGSVSDGNSGNNYSYTFVTNTTGVITARAITVTAAANSKTYDGTTSASATPTITSGSLATGDTSSFTEAYSTKNLGTNLTLTPSGSVSDGNSGNNYSITFTSSTNGTITARAITVTAATNTKTYDGTTSAAATSTITSGSLATGDTATFTEVYGTKNVGTNLTLTPSGSVSDGNSGNNYTVTFVNNTTGVITARAITVTAATNSKTYDGTTSATAAPTITSGTLATGDTANFTETYASKNAGTGLTLTPTGTVSDGNSGHNYTVTFVNNTTGVISKLGITVTAATNSKTYDGTTSATATPTVSPTVVSGDTANFTEAYASKNVGTGLTLTPSGTVNDGNSGNNYSYTFVTNTTGVITARALTVTAATNTKVYDGTTSAAAIPMITAGSLISGDIANFTEAYSTKTAGTSKTLIPAGSVSDGNNGNNYAVTFVNNTTGVITAKALTVTGVTGNNKPYDGTTSATVSTGSAVLVGVISGENVTLNNASAAGTFASASVGTGISITVSGLALSGTDAGNYTLTQPTTTGNITPKTLTVQGEVGINKVYDGTTTATVDFTNATLVGKISGDVVNLSSANYTASFADKNVATGKTVTIAGLKLAGMDANNYQLGTPQATTTANITAKALTITGVTANNKAYDGTTTATLSGTASLNGVVSGDAVTLSSSGVSASFADKNVANSKPVTVTGYAISGTDSGNYTLSQPTGLTANITALTITGSFTSNNKTYDGSTSATIASRSLTGVLGSDVVSLTGGSATFNDKNVGNAKTVTGTGFTLSGTDAANYQLGSSTLTTTVNITTLAITVTAATNTKQYDGTTSAAATPAISPALATGDTANFTETYSTKNVGSGLTLTPSGTVNDGNGGNNYAVTFVNSTTGVITARTITVTAATNTKQYDGTTSATATPTITSGTLASGDTASFTEAYSSKNVGTGLTLTPTGSVSDGNSGNNYAVTFVNNSTGVITARAITLTAATNTKVYDGTTAAAATPTIMTGTLVTGDIASFTEAYATKSVGTGLTLTPSGTVNDGNSGNNYAVTFVNNNTGVIKAATVNGSFTASDKAYDGTVAATIATRSLSGVLGSDNVSLTGGTATFTDKNVGANKAVNGTGFTLNGTDSGNYQLAATSLATTASITAAPLTITASDGAMTYGSTVPAITASYSGFAGGESSSSLTPQPTCTTTATNTSNVGTYPSTCRGAVDANYTISYVAGTVTITQASQTITFGAIPNHTYGDAALPVTATASSGLAVSFSASGNCTVSGNSVSITGAGACTITAMQAGNTNYSAATNVSQSFSIAKATPTVSFTGAPTSAYYGAQFMVSATTNASTTAVITPSGSCAISNTTVIMTSGIGVCSLQASWAADTNYTAATATQSTNALPAPVSVTVSDTTVTYDGTPKSISPTVSPAVPVAVTYTGNTSTVYATTINPPTEPGGYTVVATVTDPNYTGMGSGTLTIQQKDPALSLALMSGMPEPSSYGTVVYFELTTATSPCPTGQVDFFVDGASTSSLTVPLSDSPCTKQPIEFSTATLTPGPHSVTAVYSGDAHYLNAASTPVSHTVVADATTVTLATAATEVFVGDSVMLTATVTPANTVDATAATPTGTVQFYDNTTTLLGDSPVVANGSTFTATFMLSSLAAGPHSITATYVSANGDFSGNSSPVRLETVDKITPTINWANPANIVYGTALSNTQLNAKATDTHNGGATVNGTFTYNPAANTVLAVGTRNLSVTFTPTDANTYTTQTATATITVDAATLTVTADDVSRNYGADNPTFTFQYSGFVNGETSAVVTTPPTCTTTATPTSKVGTYPITCSGGVSANYTFKYVVGTLTVNPAGLTITANNAMKTYGETFAFAGTEFATRGLVNGETVTSVTLTSTGAAATATVAGSPYNIVPSAAVFGSGSASNYTINYAKGTLTVNAAPLTITAKNTMKTYGQTVTFAGTEFTTSGLVNGDTVASVTLTSAGASTTATVTAPGPNYAIVPGAAVGTGLGNYSISYVNGTLCVKAAPLTVTANSTMKTYGQMVTFAGTEFTSSGLVNGDRVTSVTLTSAGAAATATVAGSPYAITASAAAGTGLGNYTITYLPGTLTVNQTTLMLNVAGASGTYNATPFTAACSVASGLVNGDTVTLTVTYTSAGMPVVVPVNVGTYTATCTSSGNPNYQVASGQAQIMITPTTLTITATDQSMTFGGSAPTFTASYSGFQGHDDPSVLTGLTFTVLDSSNNPVTDFTTLKAGSYPIVASGAMAANYIFRYVNGTLTVNKAQLAGSVTVTPVDPATVAYGQPLTATVNLNSYSIGEVPVLQKHADPNDQNTQLPESLTVYLIPAGGTPSQAVKFGTATAVPTYDNSTKTSGTTKTGWMATITASAPTPGNYSAVVYGDDAPGDDTLTSVKLADAGYFYPDASDIQYQTLTSGQIDVVPAALTITANSTSKTYGQSLTFAGTEFTTTGLVNKDTVSTVTLTSAGAAANATVAGSAYNIVPSAAVGIGLNNYTITYVNGKLTVNPASLTITAKDGSKTYGLSLVFAGTEFTSSGLLNSDSITTVTLTCAGAAATATVAGSRYDIVPSAAVGSGLGNYTITYLNGKLTLNPAALTVTADPQTKTYGSADPALSYKITTGQLYNGETLAGALTRTSGENVGTYAIQQGSLAANSNYTLTFVSANLTINPAVLTVAADPQTKTYGGSDPALTYKATGFQFSDTVASALNGGLTRAAGENVGAYAIAQGTLASNVNYTVHFIGNNLTINPAVLTVAADPQTKTYGGSDPALTYKATGFQFSDTVASVLTGGLARTAGEPVAGSPYPITQGTLTGNSNYTIHFTGSTLTITPKPASVTPDPAGKVYGSADPALSGSLTGFLTADNITASYSRTAGETVGGGPYTISATLSPAAVLTNYTITYNTANFMITAKPASVTPNARSKTYGSADPAFTGALGGFLVADGVTATYSRTAGESVTQGPYTISATLSPAAVLGNYNISYSTANFNINPAPLTITASSGMFTYGGTVPTITASYSGFVGGDTAASLTKQPTCSTTATSGSPANGSAYMSSCSGVMDSNYTISYVNGSVTENAAPLTITASSGVMTYGTSPFVVMPNYSGFVNSDGPGSLTGLTCGPAFSSSTPAGSYITSCAGATDPNYAISYAGGNLVVNQATTSTSVVSSSANNTSTFMQLVTFTATLVDSTQGSTGTPTGTVTFYSNGGSIGTGTLGVVNGQGVAVLSTTTLVATTPGTYDKITAVYGGDSSFITSTSPVLQQTVQPAPIANLNPTSLSFGNTNVGTTSKGAAVTLSNLGDAALTLGTGALTFTGPNAGDFAQINNCGSSLGFAVGSNSCTITVTFSPAQTGVEVATLQITDNDDDTSGAQQFVSLTGSGLSTISGTSLYTDAIFATSTNCGAITISGGSTVNSFSSSMGYASSNQSDGGNVGTNGNVTLNGGNSAIYGSAAVNSTTTGTCSKSSVTGVTTSGGAQVKDGLIALSGQTNYPAPPPANPMPPTTTQNVTSCPSGMTGCMNMGSKVVSLAPGQYGNVTFSGGDTAHVSKGTYNFNSLTLSGKSILYVDSSPVVINIAGVSLSGGNPALDVSGGSIVNPNHIPANLQFAYGGSHGVNLSGGSDSYAVVYAPNALVNLSGGTDFFGSIIGSTVTSSGGTAVHYDSNLPNIQGGNYIWFTAVVNNVNGLPASQQVKLYLTNASISFTANGNQYNNVTVPNGVVTFNSSSQTSGAKTSYDLASGRWSTNVAKGAVTGNTFVTGFAFPVPVNFPNGIQNVTFSASFSTDTPGITLQWQWAAGVYTSLSTSYATSTNSNVLGVNPEDGGSANPNGTDPAGTPEIYKSSATFGATGGYFSAASGVVPTVAQMSASPSSLSFGIQNVSTTTSPQTSVLTNNYTSGLNISGIALGGTNPGDFALLPSSAATPSSCVGVSSLAAGASCNLYVTFTPSISNFESAKVVVTDSANNSPQTVYLTGTGQ